MSRKEAIIFGFGLVILIALALLFGMMITPTPTEKETQLPEREGIVIDGHNVEVVYDDYGMAYLKYVIGPMKTIYIPIPPEAELPNNTDSLKFYYTKKIKNDNKGKIN